MYYLSSKIVNLCIVVRFIAVVLCNLFCSNKVGKICNFSQRVYTTLLSCMYNNAPFYQNDHTKRYYFQVEVNALLHKGQKLYNSSLNIIFTYDYILTHV